MPRQAVLLGGTFDPVHHGHLIVARAVAEHFGFPRLTFVPAAAPPHKRPSGRRGKGAGCAPAASAEDRMNMVRLAIEGQDIFDVSDVELRRPAPSYTIDTLLEFRRALGDDAKLYWLIGADMLEDLPNWRRAEEVVRQATILTAVRQPYSRKVATVLAGLAGKFGHQAAAALEKGLCPTQTIDISSTQIRDRVFHGKTIAYLTPEKVAAYIKRQGLYAGGDKPV